MLLVSLSGHVGAHRFAPSLLKIIEISEYTYNVVWKTPTEATSNVPLLPTWPAECDVQNEKPVVHEGTGTISSWVINCKQPGALGLIGRELGVTGLAENQASAIVMLSMNDDRNQMMIARYGLIDLINLLRRLKPRTVLWEHRFLHLLPRTFKGEAGMESMGT